MKKTPVRLSGKTECHLYGNKNIKSKIILSLLTALSAFCGIMSILTAVNTAYGLNADIISVAVKLAIMVTAISFLINFAKFPYRWTLLLFTATVIAGILKRHLLTAGFKYMINSIIKQLVLYYDTDIPFSIIKMTGAVHESLNNLFIFFGILEAIIIAVLFFNKVRGIPLFFIGESGIILVLCTGLTVSGLSVILGFCYAVLITICSNRSTSDRNIAGIIHGQASIIFMSALLIAYAAFSAKYPVKDFRKIEKISQLKNNINRLIDTFQWNNISASIETAFNNTGKNGLTANIYNSQMGALDEIKLTDDIDLSVDIGGVTQKSELDTLYIRSFVGTIYKDNSWYASEMESRLLFRNIADGDINQFLTLQGDILYYNNMRMQDNRQLIKKYTMDIKPKAENKLAYVPYYSYSIPFNNITDDKGFVTLKSNYSYVFYTLGTQGNADNIEYICNSELPDYPETESWKKREKKYRNYVEKTCLQLPDESLMPKFYNEFSYIDYDFSKNYPYVQYVQDYLSKYAYTLSPGKTGENEDFVEDFLFNKKEGYCTYFASAATLMFRKMGIPARYAEGYIIQKKQIQSGSIKNDKIHIDIPNKQAHAWVEIYLDNFGWVPIEVTTGYSETPQQENSTTEEPQTTTKSQPETSTTATQETSTAPDDSTGHNQSNHNRTESGKIPTPAILPVIFCVLLVILILCTILYTALHARRNYIKKKRLTTLCPDKLEQWIYQIFRHCHVHILPGMKHDETAIMACEIFKNTSYKEFLYLLECIDKERYSMQCVLTDSELAKCGLILEKFGSEAYDLCGPVMKLKIYFIWGIK